MFLLLLFVVSAATVAAAADLFDDVNVVSVYLGAGCACSQARFRCVRVVLNCVALRGSKTHCPLSLLLSLNISCNLRSCV